MGPWALTATKVQATTEKLQVYEKDETNACFKVLPIEGQVHSVVSKCDEIST